MVALDLHALYADAGRRSKVEKKRRRVTQLLRTLSQVKVGLIEAGGVVVATTVLMVVVPMPPMMSLALTSGNVQSNEYRVCPVTWR